jgi:hypothetical protein
LKYLKNNQTMNHLNEQEFHLLEDLFKKTNLKNNYFDFGIINIVGSHLPSNSNECKSFISSQLLKVHILIGLKFTTK